MALGTALGLGLAGLGSVKGLFDEFYSIWDNERKYKTQLNQLNIQNDLAERQMSESVKYNDFNRYLAENGVQVRANDLARAGLSKVLASGSTPSYVTGSTSGSVSAPNMGQAFKPSALMNALQMARDFQQKDAELAILRAQKKGLDLENEYKQFENDYWRHQGIPSNADTTTKKFQSFFTYLEDTIGTALDRLDKNPPTLKFDFSFLKDIGDKTKEEVSNGLKSFFENLTIPQGKKFFIDLGSKSKYVREQALKQFFDYCNNHDIALTWSDTIRIFHKYFDRSVKEDYKQDIKNTSDSMIQKRANAKNNSFMFDSW